MKKEIKKILKYEFDEISCENCESELTNNACGEGDNLCLLYNDYINWELSEKLIKSITSQIMKVVK